MSVYVGVTDEREGASPVFIIHSRITHVLLSRILTYALCSSFVCLLLARFKGQSLPECYEGEKMSCVNAGEFGLH